MVELTGLMALWGLGAAVVALLLWPPVLRSWRRRRIVQGPFPDEWRRVLRQHWPYFRRLPADLQLQLKKRMQIFLAEKPVIGCGGLRVTDAMRVLVAAQACLLLLNRGQEAFANVREVLLYPNAFVASRSVTDAGGLVREQQLALAGESSVRGQVVLSWGDVLDGAAIADDGRNVVLHEFAHQLDQAKGSATGLPVGVGRHQLARWSQVMSAEYDLLQRRIDAGVPTLINAYGGTDPAEFFAVATESFFEQPQQLAAAHAELYQVLSDYYRVNPTSWC